MKAQISSALGHHIYISISQDAVPQILIPQGGKNDKISLGTLGQSEESLAFYKLQDVSEPLCANVNCESLRERCKGCTISQKYRTRGNRRSKNPLENITIH